MTRQEFTDQIEKDLKDYTALLEAGKWPGFTCGFEAIDRLTGKMQPGQLWAIGAYSGVGKSYFVLNMADRILDKTSNLKVSIFSTELSAQAYAIRHIYMRMGVWKLGFEQSESRDVAAFKAAAQDYIGDQAMGNTFNIYGNITNFDEISKALARDAADIVFVDFVQELSFGKTSATSDAMPLVAKGLRDLAIRHNTVIVAVSQISNYSTKNDNSKSMLSPFDYGKELNRAAHVSLVLEREKAGGVLLQKLNLIVHKARDGQSGRVLFQIMPGYQLKNISLPEYERL